MPAKINVFIIESEEPNSPTSVRKLWTDIQKDLNNAGLLGQHEFVDAPTKADVQSAADKFEKWISALPENEPVVLWLSVHGADPEPGVAEDNRTCVGYSGASSKGERIEWLEFFEPVRKAKNSARVVVLMDVCWGSSPTAPARLTTPSKYRPAFLFGPARSANRTELDAASRSLFSLLAKNGIPASNEATTIVDELNSRFPKSPSTGTSFYRVWWWESSGLLRHP